MTKLFSVLLFLALWPWIEPNSKPKLRMDVLVAATFVGTANDDGMKSTLLTFPERFEFDQNHTRMAVFIYDYAITPVISFTDTGDEVVKTIKAIKNRPDDHRSVFADVLEEMLRISKSKGRKTALKLFIVLTDKTPTKGDRIDLEFRPILPVSDQIKANGLFLIVYDSWYDHDLSLLTYFKALCGDENLIIIKTYKGIQKTMNEKVIPKILARACKLGERVCYFADTSLRTCLGIWYYPTSYLPDDECRAQQRGNNPQDCDVTECYQHCDHYWPWQNETANCDCKVGNTRRGDMPFLYFHYCPKVKQCERCESSAKVAGTEVWWQKGLRLEMWAIVVLAVVGVAALGVVLFVIITLKK